MRSLATIAEIIDIAPIPNADNIEVATIRGWQVVAKKGDFKVGDKCVYCEIDSMLPTTNPHFEFLTARATHKDYFRVRTIKLRGQISQGIVFPLTILSTNNYQIDDDVTNVLNIKKYEPQIPAILTGDAKGLFPNYIPKTDEVRIQNLTNKIDNYRNTCLYVTEKLDGTSSTFYHKDGVFGACSRNLDWKQTDNNLYWNIAKKLNLANKLRELNVNIAIQGEIIGPSIQKNRLARPEHEFYMFSAYIIKDNGIAEPFDFESLLLLAQQLEVSMVPVIYELFKFENSSVLDLINKFMLKSMLNSSKHAEGCVIRSRTHNPYFSCKIINPEYLLKHGE